MIPRKLLCFCAVACLSAPSALPVIHAADTVITAVSARTGNGYKREKLKDGSFKPEFYALSNGGQVFGTTSDVTVDRIPYPQVAEIAMRFLAGQKYHYAKSAGDAKLLLVLQWGNTLAPNGTHKEMNVATSRAALATLQQMKEAYRGPEGAISKVDEGIIKNALNGFGRGIQFGESGAEAQLINAGSSVEASYLRILSDDLVRDRLNATNARVLGYTSELNAADGIQRWAGGGDRFTDLITDIEESRYYIVISAYDFAELTKQEKKTLLWQVRVSVQSPGNSFGDSYAAMLKAAAKYFGQDSGKLIRGEETKGVVELGDLKFLGEAKNFKPGKPGATPVNAEQPRVDLAKQFEEAAAAAEKEN